MCKPCMFDSVASFRVCSLIICGHSLYTGLIPQYAPNLDSLLNDPQFSNQTEALSPQEKYRLVHNSDFQKTGNGYFIEQTTRVSMPHPDVDVDPMSYYGAVLQPATIGLALYDNPVGQLAWIGEKFLECEFHQSPSAGLSPRSEADADFY